MSTHAHNTEIPSSVCPVRADTATDQHTENQTHKKPPASDILTLGGRVRASLVHSFIYVANKCPEIPL